MRAGSKFGRTSALPPAGFSAARYRKKKGRLSVGRITIIAFALASLFGTTSASAAPPNSCANVDIMGTFDESGIRESDYGVSAAPAPFGSRMNRTRADSQCST